MIRGDNNLDLNLDRNRKNFQNKMFKTLKEYNKVILDSTTGKKIYQSKTNLIKKFNELKQKLSKAEQYYLVNNDSDEELEKTGLLKRSNPMFTTPKQKNLKKPFGNNYSDEKPINYSNLISKNGINRSTYPFNNYKDFIFSPQKVEVNEEGKYVLPLFPSKIIRYPNPDNSNTINNNNHFNNFDDSPNNYLKKYDKNPNYNSNILNNKKKKKRKSRKRRKKNLKYVRDKARRDINYFDPLRSTRYPSIYSIRPSYRFTHSPNASKTRFCDCCDRTNLPSLREQLYKWSHDLKSNLYDYSKKKY